MPTTDRDTDERVSGYLLTQDEKRIALKTSCHWEAIASKQGIFL